MNMIAVGSSIGTGLFLGTGNALAVGGPLALIIAFVVIGFLVFNVVYALGEVSIIFPSKGGPYEYASRFIDPIWGFAMGWNYTLQWIIVLPLELTAAAMTMKYWTPNVPSYVWITVFFVLVILMSIFGIIVFGEEEFWSACLKLVVIMMFIIFSIVMLAGGGPSSGAYSEPNRGIYWHEPGFLAHGFKGMAAVLVTAAFSFAGTELIGIAAGECEDPHKSIPPAIKNVFWRITIFYILSAVIIGLLVPYNDPRLMGGSYDANRSPFVIVFNMANVAGLDHVVNATITVSILSIALSCVFAGSRTMCALAEQKFAPKFLKYVDRKGRPIIAVLFSLMFGFLAYINLTASGVSVFRWLLAASGLSTLFTWGSICLAHIVFRRAWVKQGHSLDEIAFKAPLGIAGSVCGLILVFMVLVVQLYVAVSPIEGKITGEGFIKEYLSVIVIILLYSGGLIWKRRRPRMISLEEVNLVTGRSYPTPSDENEVFTDKSRWYEPVVFWGEKTAKIA